MKILRWLLFLPTGILVYSLAQSCFLFPLYFTKYKILYIGNDSDANGFVNYNIGEHIFVGLFMVCIIEAIAVGAGLYSAIYIAPGYRKVIFFVLYGLGIAGKVILSLFIIKTPLISGINIYWAESIGQYLGLIISSVIVWNSIVNSQLIINHE